MDTMKRKQFIKGISQIAQEGAIQIFQEFNTGMEEIIVGVVGVLQFEVLTLEQERWLIASTFARADMWVQLWGRHADDTLLRSFTDVTRASLRGFQRLGHFLITGGRRDTPAATRSGDAA